MEYVCISETMQLEGSYVEDLLYRQQQIFSWTSFKRTSSFTIVQLSRVSNEGWSGDSLRKEAAGAKEGEVLECYAMLTLHKNKEFIKSNCSLFYR